MSVSRETKLEAYLELLQRWGSSLNLTSARHSSCAALRSLVDDCLCITPHLPSRLDRLIDLGSGQGLPAIPLAIETGIAIELIEADKRKAAFLTTVLASLNLQGVVHASRIEATQLPPARCVTARALTSLSGLATLAHPFLAPDGYGLFLKGPAALSEIGRLAAEGRYNVELLATTRPPSTLVKLTPIG